MQGFHRGDKVRKRGESQVMIIKGKAGLISSTHLDPSIRGKVICGWTNKKGHSVTRIFETDALERVT